MSKNIFFITGLPRSRTAWLANWFTHGDSFCFHEACRKVKSIAELPALFDSVASPNVGTADCGFLRYHEKALEMFPEAKILFVRRRPEACALSTVAFLDGSLGINETASVTALLALYKELDATMEALHNTRLVGSPRFREIEFEEIGEPKQFAAGSEWLVPGSWNEKRYEELNDIRMNVIPERAIEQAKASGWAKLAGTPRRGVQEMPRTAGPAVPTLPESSIATPLMEQYHALLSELCGGEQAAYVWLQQLWEVVLTWDHIVDRDAVDVPMAERAFESLMFLWPGNPFWQAHKDRLVPVLVNAVAAWRYSNVVNRPERGWDMYTEVPCAVAGIIGGLPHVARYSTRLRDLVDQLRAEDTRKDIAWP